MVFLDGYASRHIHEVFENCRLSNGDCEWPGGDTCDSGRLFCRVRQQHATPKSVVIEPKPALFADAEERLVRGGLGQVGVTLHEPGAAAVAGGGAPAAIEPSKLAEARPAETDSEDKLVGALDAREQQAEDHAGDNALPQRGREPCVHQLHARRPVSAVRVVIS